MDCRQTKSKYNLSHDIVEKNAELRLDAKSNPNLVIGGRISKFISTDNRNQENIGHEGCLISVQEKSHRSSFFYQSVSKKTIEDAVSTAESNSNVRMPYILKRRMTALTYKTNDFGTDIVKVYDPFDATFEEWIKINPQAAFEEENGLFNAWWRRQIRNILDTIEYCHKKGLTHGSLGDVSSYVVFENNIHLIDMKKDESGKTINVLKDEDLFGFRDFLLHYVDCLHSSYDWTLFIDSFDFSRVDQLKRHPLLRDQVDRFNYYQDINDAMNDMHPCGRSRRKILSDMDAGKPSHLQNWCSKIVRGSSMSTAFGYSSYDTNSIGDLLRFIRNLIRHYDTLNEFKPGFGNRQRFDTLISSIYPGLLSYMHNSLVENTDNTGITSE